MKFTLILFLTTNLLFGCKENSKQSFYNLINDNFFIIVDTIAYKSGRLIQIPNDTNNINSLNKICIMVDTVFQNYSELNQSLLKSVVKENLQDFEELLLNDKDSEFDAMDISQFTKTGKFTLIKSKMTSGTPCSVIAGKITFYKPYIKQNKAIIVFSISESSKAGFTNSFFFRKKNGLWENIKKIEIERW
jgi:hypothetical protein